VQEYISSPLLVDMLKFDLRVYVVVTSIEPLEVAPYFPPRCSKVKKFANMPHRYGNSRAIWDHICQLAEVTFPPLSQPIRAGT